jgi:phosphoribosylformylglycinamidine synthase
MMFAQANSEHCRHKIFNASWAVDGEAQPRSLFEMIRNTHRHINGAGILSAYADNAAVIEGHVIERFVLDPDTHGTATIRREPHPDEGRDPQPSHCDRAVSRCSDRVRRRDP